MTSRRETTRELLAALLVELRAIRDEWRAYHLPRPVADGERPAPDFARATTIGRPK